jgi:hypothetical protein
MFLIGSPEREDGSLSQEAAFAPQAVLLATPALPGSVYTFFDKNGRSALLRIVKVLVYII